MNENKENQNNSKMDDIEKAVILEIIRRIREELEDIETLIK